jgi:prepilin-type N-terminal cleavage/methylation domain-containing protein
MRRKTHSQAGFAWIELLVVAAILLIVASFIVRLRYGHAWLAAEYSFVQSLGISRDVYDICKIAVLVIAFVGYAVYRRRRDRRRL